MIYKQFLKQYSREPKNDRALVVKIIKITVCVLAAAFLLTSILIAVDMIGGFDTPSQRPSSDRTKPTVRLKEGDVIYMYAGENVSFRDKVIANDDSGNYRLDVSSQVNADVPGSYTVTYTVTDAAGNVTTLPVTVIVTKQNYTYDMLMTAIAVKASSLGLSADMDKTTLIFKIYDYVNSAATIKFTDESNVPAINRANWKSDWIEEASRVLNSGEGDCYSYYSLSKAFFEYFGIENMGIKRDESQSNMSGTHFWSMVNIGTASAPQWYFYDATRLAGKFTDGTKNACLRTAAELQSYVPSNTAYYGFYAFNSAGYPKTATTKIPR